MGSKNPRELNYPTCPLVDAGHRQMKLTRWFCFTWCGRIIDTKSSNAQNGTCEYASDTDFLEKGLIKKGREVTGMVVTLRLSLKIKGLWGSSQPK